jgi:hypothetical protein
MNGEKARVSGEVKMSILTLLDLIGSCFETRTQKIQKTHVSSNRKVLLRAVLLRATSSLKAGIL